MPSFQLILQFRGRAVEDTDEVLEVEDALFEMLGEGEELDGHEIGAGTRNICIVTADAEATFGRLAPFLARANLIAAVIAAARPLPGERYTVLWPRNHPSAFSRT
jgi:hypothetical protein